MTVPARNAPIEQRAQSDGQDGNRPTPGCAAGSIVRAAPPPLLIGCGPEHVEATPEAVGFKASNLARMARLGMPVPPAFVIGTAWSAHAQDAGPELWSNAMLALEAATGLRFGDARRPLLLSVRSGAAVSMPGMLDTLLNIGLNDQTLRGLIRLTGNPRLAWDAYRRLIAGFSETVLGLPSAAFEVDLALVAEGRDERDLDFIELRTLARRHLATVEQLCGQPFPQDPIVQLNRAIAAVFGSWSSSKAHTYRSLNGLSESMGTAVTVQRMVFGNAGGVSGAGVGFTRHPSTGEPEPWVDFLFNAQGEDVVSGRRSAAGHEELASVAPALWEDMLTMARQLERAFGDMQDFEFTIENGRLFLLQTRAGKRTPQAAVRIALDLCAEGVIDVTEALRRTASFGSDSLCVMKIVADSGREASPLAHAQSACSGVAVGEIAFDEARARSRSKAGAKVILVRHDADTHDIGALDVAQGLLTVRGARTSHAAVVARQLGKVCLVACDALRIDQERHCLRLGDIEFAEGEVITLDGNAGAVYEGAAKTVREPLAELLARLQNLRSAMHCSPD